MIALSALAGAVTALGLVLVAVGLVGGPGGAAPRPVRRRPWPVGVRPGARGRGPGARRVAVVAGAPLVGLALTGWPVAALLALVAAVGLPRVLGGRRAAAAGIARLEALAAWTRRLADVLTAGAGIEQAVQASLPAAPPPIRPEVARLVAQLGARRPTEEALRGFAEDLHDPTGDLVVAALLLAADRRGRGLARLLTTLAATVEQEVAMRRGVEADRAQPRTTARWVTYITVAVAGGLLVFDRAYVAPFGTPTGQVALALVGALFALALAWMHRLTTTAPAQRFLPASARDGAPVPAGVWR